MNSVHDIVSRFVLRLYRVYFLLKMPRRLSTEELRRLLEESDFELNNDDTDSNGSNSDVEDESDPDVSRFRIKNRLFLLMTTSMILILIQVRFPVQTL